MESVPDFETFARLAADGKRVPLHRRLLADVLTPVTAFARLDDGGPGGLFESVIGGERVGRYSILASAPYMSFQATRNQVRVGSDAGEEVFEVADPIAELKRRIQAVRVADVPGLPPFVGGAIGYFAYDVVRYTEHLPNAPADDRQLPDLAFAFYDRLVVFDNIQKLMLLIVLAPAVSPERDARACYDAALSALDALTARLSTPRQRAELQVAEVLGGESQPLAYRSNFTQAEFERKVGQCVGYIRAGDIFQVVISQRLELPLAVDPLEVYRTLRVVNPSPFMFFLRAPNCTLVGCSPEVMVRVMDGQVTVRPLAGTRPRGKNPEEDARLAEDLLADPKERAEHVMLVDLGRNDVGRVARFGSVQLSDVMTIERYSHVMHITSNVTGQLSADKDAFDALRACLPAGTVSGAPKVRAMEIIDELEPQRRGPYGGAVGYVDFRGNMDTCIALRTLVIKDNVAYIQAGCGVVADSDPTSEYQETLNKAKALLRAIELTLRRLSVT